MIEKEFISRFMPLRRSLYALSFSILKNESDAADCLQEVYTKMWEKREQLAEMENPEGYCMVAVRRAAIDLLRRRSKEQPAESDPPPDIAGSEATPAEIAEHRDNLRLLRQLLTELPQRQREVVEMSGVSGLSNSEIEEATGLSGDNVRVLLSRGRKRLRELFEKKR